MNGFRAGQALPSRCPYPPGATDAQGRLEGWAVIHLLPIYFWRMRPATLRVKGVS